MPALACLLLLAARLVWDGPGASHLGSPSPDGRYLTGIDPDHKPAGSREFAYFSVFSRDSRQVAYAWFNADGFYELRLISVSGGQPRTVYRNEEAGFVQPTAFSKDGKQILTLLFRRDNIYRLTGDRVEQIGEGWSPAYSPDASRLAWLGRRPGENFGVEFR